MSSYSVIFCFLFFFFLCRITFSGGEIASLFNIRRCSAIPSEAPPFLRAPQKFLRKTENQTFVLLLASQSVTAVSNPADHCSFKQTLQGANILFNEHE